jgi:hypothetical protein
MLSFHASFDIQELFRNLDANDKGYVTPVDLEKYFEPHEDMTGTNYLKLINYWSGTQEDDRLTFEELRSGL